VPRTWVSVWLKPSSRLLVPSMFRFWLVVFVTQEEKKNTKGRGKTGT
jgi:hypothetical protein